LVASIAWTLWNYRRSLIHALEAAGYEVILLAAEDKSCFYLEQQTQASFYPLQQLSRRSLSLLQNFRALLELYTAFRRHRPELALFFTIRPNTLGNFAATLAGIPTISTIEGLGIAGSAPAWLRWFTERLYKLAFLHTRKVIFLNEEDRKEFQGRRLVEAPKAVFIHGPGIDLQHFSPQVRSHTNPDFVFLFVARLLQEKGIQEFAEAARLLKNKGVNATFQVLGSTDPGNPTTIDETTLNAWVREGIIEHLGFLEDVRPVITNADVLVLPSYYREGVPRSVLEAMGMEKPIITTDHVGCRDTVEDGKNGFLVPPRDPLSLAEAMEKMFLLTPEQRLKMGQYSRRKAIEEFDDQWVIPQYLALIQDTIKPD
jgi:glycosyltransferase involved in cell wall biosynthesis